MPDIEKNIPVPSPLPRPKYEYLLTMEIGDSVKVPTEEFNSVRSSVAYLSRMHDMKFTTRTNDGTGNHRIWRVG